MVEIKKLHSFHFYSTHIKRLIIYSNIPFGPTGHQRSEAHNVKVTSGQDLERSGPVDPLSQTPKRTVIKLLSAEADMFIPGAPPAQHACVYLPRTHAGCANAAIGEENARGIMAAKIIVY